MRYIIKAFLERWNLLVVGAGIASGFIFGVPDVILPVLAAGEIIYISALATRPDFQKVVDASLMNSPDQSQPTDQKLLRVLSSLTIEERQSFESLKKRLTELRHIARQIKDDADDGRRGKADPHLDGIDRLLWIYLKLLYSKNALNRFFKTLDRDEIEKNIQQVKQRILTLGPEKDDTTGTSKRRKSLRDTLDTLEQRLDNYLHSKENYDYIDVELERLHSKISNLAEMGISRQAPEIISSEIDVVSDSVRNTEKIMNDLEFLTGISLKEEETPLIMRRAVEE